MANYIDFIRVISREKSPRRFIYVCGSEKVLVEDVVDRVRASAGADPAHAQTFFAGQDSASTIWTEMSQFPLDPEATRLITVRNAERLTGWEHFDAWMTGAARTPIIVLMVADEREWPTDRHKDARARLMSSTRAQYVECNFAKDTQIEMATRTVMLWENAFQFDARPKFKKTGKKDIYISPSARYLVERTGCDLARCRDVCSWLGMMNLRKAPQTQLLDLLATKSPTDDFVTCLLRVDKPGALNVMPEVEDNPRRIVGILSQKLTDLDRVYRSMRFALTKFGTKDGAVTEVVKDTGLSYYEVKSLWDAAGNYDVAAIQKRAELLLAIDEHIDSDGVLAVLVAQW